MTRVATTEWTESVNGTGIRVEQAGTQAITDVIAEVDRR